MGSYNDSISSRHLQSGNKVFQECLSPRPSWEHITVITTGQQQHRRDKSTELIIRVILLKQCFDIDLISKWNVESAVKFCRWHPYCWDNIVPDLIIFLGSQINVKCFELMKLQVESSLDFPLVPSESYIPARKSEGFARHCPLFHNALITERTRTVIKCLFTLWGEWSRLSFYPLLIMPLYLFLNSWQ